jgi:signal transduction histidine kinase
MNNNNQQLIDWNKVRANIEITDKAFFFLRIIVLFGGILWLTLSDVPEYTFRLLTNLFIYFIVYSVFTYIWLLISPDKKKTIYLFFLIFDIPFTFLLVYYTGGFHSHFVNGFYLMTALYSFYFGLVPGVFIAAAASALYLIAGGIDLNKHYWPDYSVSIAFMFLLSVPLGMLSQKLKKDKAEISFLNRDLKGYIKELQSVHGRLIQVEKMSELGRMAADVAHEIRNPLTSIGGYARRLEKNLSQIKTEKECVQSIFKEKEYAEIIINEVNRLERILKDILTFSRDVQYHMELQKLNGIIKESVMTFEDLIMEQSINVETKADDAVPDVLMDRDQLKQTLINFISNAIDAMPKGGDLEIKTYIEEMNNINYAVLEVRDSGHGIPDKKMENIFEPFYSSKELGEGTGLGLSICKKIIDEHHGLIKVESTLGKGTSFKVLLPVPDRKDDERTRCWEFHNCGADRIEGGSIFRCPAYPEYGLQCWAVAGTYCGNRVSGVMAQKLGECQKCEFYKKMVTPEEKVEQ